MKKCARDMWRNCITSEAADEEDSLDIGGWRTTVTRKKLKAV